MFYSRQQQFDASFLINVFKNKINCCCVMDIVVLRVPTKKIRDFSTYKYSNISWLSLSAKCVTAARIIWRSLDIFNKHIVFLQDAFFFVQSY
jgi:hypothetical protein